MSVHMVRIVSEWPDGYTLTDIQNAVQNWIDNHNEWAEDLSSHDVFVAHTEPGEGGVEHIYGNFRFDWTDDRSDLLDDAEATLQQYVAWYRLGYHICDHDADDGGCNGWEDTREYGTVTTGVESFT